MRSNGLSKCDKLMVKNKKTAIIGHYHYGPIFGGGNGHAINITCSGCRNNNYYYNNNYGNANCGHGSAYSYISCNGLESDCDIFIRDGSNSSYVCEANIGHSYECPEGYFYGEQNTVDYLAGSKKKWLTTEIEVYQINENCDGNVYGEQNRVDNLTVSNEELLTFETEVCDEELIYDSL